MNRKLLSRATALLREEAEFHRESCQVARPNLPPWDWACCDCPNKAACPVRARHDELVKCAEKIERLMYEHSRTVAGKKSCAHEWEAVGCAGGAAAMQCRKCREWQGR